MHAHRILLLVSDAFGGQGGIAKFNRDLVTALALQENVVTVVGIPRNCTGEISGVPTKALFMSEAAGSKIRYVKALIGALRRGTFDIVICGHINLTPLAYAAKAMTGARLVLVIHGIDAWQPTRSRMANFIARRADLFVAVSEVTKRRFMSWTGLSDNRGYVLPNCFERERFIPGPKSDDLVARYGLQGKLVVMTCGRLASNERYKGLDEVMEVLPELSVKIPNLTYLIVGDGDDRPRLQAKAKDLQLDGRVVFTGFVSEAEKVDHYRLADAYVMPGRGEGFGIVYLEAMACGIPTVGSKLDGSTDALRGGSLGILVDPNDRSDIMRGIVEALARGKHVPEGLDYFSFENYAGRVGGMLARMEELGRSR